MVVLASLALAQALESHPPRRGSLVSASERLRELSALYDMGIAEAGDRYGPDVEHRTVVVRALPLIAEAVKVAEELLPIYADDQEQIDNEWGTCDYKKENDEDYCRWRDTLAKLEEALQ